MRVRPDPHVVRTLWLSMRAQVLIRRGELVMGVLCKKTLGAAGGGLIHITFLEHGPDYARRLINNLQVSARPGCAGQLLGSCACGLAPGAPASVQGCLCSVQGCLCSVQACLCSVQGCLCSVQGCLCVCNLDARMLGRGAMAIGIGDEQGHMTRLLA